MLTLVLLLVAFPAMADHGEGHPAGTEAGQTGSSILDVFKDLGPELSGGGGDEFLHPDEAFVFSTEPRDADTVVARWDLADGYYLYRDKFEFALEGAEGTELRSARLPPGKVKNDPYFGRMEVYYGTVEALLALERSVSGPTDVTLRVGYQGCADAGLCYPPMTKSVSLALPAAIEPPDRGVAEDSGIDARQVPSIPTGELPEQDRLARSLAGGVTWLVLLGFFGLGLLLTFTPCVLPMIPILSSIIVGQGEGLTTRKAFTLSLTFVLAMAATYTVAGVVAGLSGANLQAVFQNPWVLGVFSGLFVLLALAMFGLYDLQVPASLQARLTALSNRQQGGTYIGVGIMGFLSALIVGPCVAAPLAGALIYIAQTGDAVLGGMALFALSLGMGTPILLIGTSAGRLLPKVGPWMSAVKAAFGVLLLGVAIYLLERIVPEWVVLLLWGALLCVVAVYLGAFDALGVGASGPRRLAKGVGLVALVYGVVLVVGGTAGGDDVFRPLGAFSASDSEVRSLRFRPVKGLAGLEVELALASSQGRPVMLDFYADWCVSCKELERYTFSDPGVQAVLSNAVLLQSDVTANDARDRTLLQALGLFGPPAILFFGPDGEERRSYRVVGFMDAKPFRAHAVRALGLGEARRAGGRVTPGADRSMRARSAGVTE